MQHQRNSDPADSEEENGQSYPPGRSVQLTHSLFQGLPPELHPLMHPDIITPVANAGRKGAGVIWT